jgi:hypothetical protein
VEATSWIFLVLFLVSLTVNVALVVFIGKIFVILNEDVDISKIRERAREAKISRRVTR